MKIFVPFFVLLVIAVPFSNGQQRPTGAGTIAYIRDGVEVRLVNPDGTNDRRLWTHQDATKPLGIDSLAWSPDGKQIAISSRHAAVASLYDADLYLVKLDGSNQTLMRDSANIFRYDFATRRVTQITQLQNEFTGSFSVSPDGEWIVFERSKTLDQDRQIDIWIARIDGKNARLLVRNGFAPSWR